MKKILAIVLSVVMLLTAMPLTSAFATEATGGACGDNLTWTFDYEGTLTISGEGEMWNDYKSESDFPWHDKKDSIKSIVINDGVTSIASSAFSKCCNATNIYISDSVTSIGDFAFAYCTGITNLELPDSLTDIGLASFLICTGITSLTIPDSVRNIGYAAFENCTALESVTIPYGIERIEKYTFASCLSLTSVNIPDSVTSIGNGAFLACTSLASVAISENVTQIGEEAFAWCYSLKNIVIPEKVTSIGDHSFAYCLSLTSITVPDSLTSVGEDAFCDYISLDKAIIKNPELDLNDSGLGYYKTKLKVSLDEFIQLFKQASIQGNNAVNDLLKNSVETFDEPKPLEDVNIYGYIDSTAQKYANENGFNFIDIETLQQHEHGFDSSITKAPTCTEEGIMTYACSCGESYTETIAKLPHTYGEWMIIKSATCTETGAKVKTCACGDTVTETIAATGNHTDTTGDGKCDTCGKGLGTKPSESKSFGEKINDFFQKIIDWFKNIFKR